MSFALPPRVAPALREQWMNYEGGARPAQRRTSSAQMLNYGGEQAVPKMHNYEGYYWRGLPFLDDDVFYVFGGEPYHHHGRRRYSHGGRRYSHGGGGRRYSHGGGGRHHY